MEHIHVEKQRESVPNWAAPTATQSAAEPTASQRQLDYITSLMAKKQLSQLPTPQRERLEEQHPEFWVEETTRLSKPKASRIIEKLLTLSDRPKEQQGVPDIMADRFSYGIPAGRYAVENDADELRFYNVWISRDGKRLNVYVAHGPDDSDLRFQKTIIGVLKKIKAYGIRRAAIRYGMEIGSCSNCGRRLTNRISRELGIGPVCGGRMFGDDFKTEVKEKRAEIRSRGLNPNEELTDEEG